MTNSTSDRINEEQIFLSLPPSVRESFSTEQSQAVKALVARTVQQSKPSAKIVDLRFVIDLVMIRYYFVLLVGRDRRSHQRNASSGPLSRVGNIIAVIGLLLGLNLLVTSFIFLSLYLTKSALGIDLFPGHMGKTPASEVSPSPRETN